MFNSFGAKLAMKKLGIPKDALSFMSPAESQKPSSSSSSSKKPNTTSQFDQDDDQSAAAAGTAAPAWPNWMRVKNLPLTVQPWLSTNPPPVPVAAQCPAIGDFAPADRDGKLVLGKGRKVIVVFLRCVGCAFAQQTFLTLRALAAKSQNSQITVLAISHASAAATTKWLDLIGGAWNVQVIIDDDRSVYAAWGLGLSSVWYYFNPATQTAAWKVEKGGWLGARVAGSIGRTAGAGLDGDSAAVGGGSSVPAASQGGGGGGAPASEGQAQVGGGGGGAAGNGPVTPVMGNKWQQGGAFAIDERGVVVWGGKAKSADELMDFEAGFAALLSGGGGGGGR